MTDPVTINMQSRPREEDGRIALRDGSVWTERTQELEPPAAAGKHECPGGCGRLISDALLACAYHWRMVPKAIQTEVYRTYRARGRSPRDQAAVAAHQGAMRRAVDAMTRRT